MVNKMIAKRKTTVLTCSDCGSSEITASGWWYVNGGARYQDDSGYHCEGCGTEQDELDERDAQ